MPGVESCMNRRSLFLSSLGAAALGLLASPICAAETLPRKVYAKAARWRDNPSPAWFDFYGGKPKTAEGVFTVALSSLRVLETHESRDVAAIRAAVGSDRIERLEPIRGSERFTIKVGTTETDAVTLHLSERDFDALAQLLDRVTG